MSTRIATNVNAAVEPDPDVYDPVDAWFAGDIEVLPDGVTIETKFDPHELRVPKGRHGGGRWGAGGFAATLRDAVKPAEGHEANHPSKTGMHFVVGEKPGSSGNFERDAKRVMARLRHYYEKGSDTETLYDHVEGAPGKYTAEREAQQRKVIDHFLNAPGVKSERKIVMLGGLPGSGKTTFLNSEVGKKALPGFDPKEYVIVNPDEVKDYMAAHGMAPVYPGLTKGEAVGLYHEEASMLSKAVLEAAAAQGKNIVYDVTLKNASQAQLAKHVLDRNGDHYHRTAVFIDVPTSLAAERAQYRYQQGEGRFVPVENIHSQADPGGEYWSANRRAFETIKGGMSHWITVDNTNPDGKGPKIIGQGGSPPNV